MTDEVLLSFSKNRRLFFLKKKLRYNGCNNICNIKVSV